MTRMAANTNVVIPANAGIQAAYWSWTPASAGVTTLLGVA